LTVAEFLSPAPREHSHPPWLGYRIGDALVVKRDRWLILLFLSPGLVVFLITIVLPALLAIRFSLFTQETFFSTAKFVGADNYVRLLRSARFQNDLWRTTIYTLGSISCQLILGIAIALVLHQSLVLRSFFRGANVLPYIVPTVVVAFTWKWMLLPQIGIVETILRTFGSPGIQFFSPRMALATVILISTWAWTPFVVLVFLAALQTVPDELYESARIDRANAVQQFMYITLPMLKPVIAMIILLRGIWMFNKFDLIWLLTEGGPLEATETLPILIYLKTLRLFQIGEGTALATLSLAIMLAVATVYFRVLKLEEQ
jgi:multiple sugar transport system permease protein